MATSWCCGDFVANFIIKSSLPFWYLWCHAVKREARLAAGGGGGDLRRLEGPGGSVGAGSKAWTCRQTGMPCFTHSFVHATSECTGCCPPCAGSRRVWNGNSRCHNLPSKCQRVLASPLRSGLKCSQCGSSRRAWGWVSDSAWHFPGYGFEVLGYGVSFFSLVLQGNSFPLWPVGKDNHLSADKHFYIPRPLQ